MSHHRAIVCARNNLTLTLALALVPLLLLRHFLTCNLYSVAVRQQVPPQSRRRENLSVASCAASVRTGVGLTSYRGSCCNERLSSVQRLRSLHRVRKPCLLPAGACPTPRSGAAISTASGCLSACVRNASSGSVVAATPARA